MNTHHSDHNKRFFRAKKSLHAKRSPAENIWAPPKDTAKTLVSVMEGLKKTVTNEGNVFDCIIAADAGHDLKKEDPTVAGLIITPDKVVFFAKRVKEEDIPKHWQKKGISTQNLEELAVNEGRRLSDPVHTKLIITDNNEIFDAHLNSQHAHFTDDKTIIAHPLNHDTYMAVHDIAHNLVQYTRQKNRGVNVTYTLSEIEEISKKPSIYKGN